MTPFSEPGDDRPTWTVSFDVEGGDQEFPSRFVEVTVTHRLEVTDAAALRHAVATTAGPPRDEFEERLRVIPANLVGLALSGPLTLPAMPGVERRGSTMTVGEYEAEDT